MSTWTSLEPASTTVDPGSTATVRLRVRNTGDVVDEYRLVPVGPVAPYTSVEPATLRLYPGTTGTAAVTFAPPRTPDSAAGPTPYAIQIIPTEHPEATTVPEGNLTITPFTEVRAELVPHTVRGWLRGRSKLAVDNLGNTPLTASVGAADNSDQVSTAVHPANVRIEPGRAAFVRATVRPQQITWFGPKQERPYALAVRRSGTKPVDVSGTYVQRGFLPRWVAACLGLLMGLVIAFIALWIGHRPNVATRAQERVQQAAATTLPTPDPPPTTTAPSTAASTPAAGSDDSGDGSGSGGGGGGGSHHKKKKPKDPASQTRILIRNTATKKCANLPGYDAGKINGPVTEFRCNGSRTDDNQLWDFQVRYPHGGPDGASLFQIRNDKDKYCMDLPDYKGQPATTDVTEFTCNGTTSDNQLWYLVKRPHGGYWIRNYASNGLCLDVSGYSTGGDGTKLTIYDCSDTDDQVWTLVHP